MVLKCVSFDSAYWNQQCIRDPLLKNIYPISVHDCENRFHEKKIFFLKNVKSIFLFISGNYTLGSPGGHSTTGLFVNSGLPNGHGGPNGHHNSSSNNGPISFLNGGTSLANLGLMTNNSHLPPNIQNQSPTSVLSNYSLNRNLNQLNLNLVPRNNR